MKEKYRANLKDANDLIEHATSFKVALEQTGPLVLSRDLLKRWDEIERLTKRLHNRLHS